MKGKASWLPLDGDRFLAGSVEGHLHLDVPDSLGQRRVPNQSGVTIFVPIPGAFLLCGDSPARSRGLVGVTTVVTATATTAGVVAAGVAIVVALANVALEAVEKGISAAVRDPIEQTTGEFAEASFQV